MKTVILCLFVVLFVFSLQAKAELIVRGTDSLGYQLIYDSDLNITWYDYTHSGQTPWGDIWQNQVNWANNLIVSGGDLVGVYDDWRLPTALNQDGTGPCDGYFTPCTGSEMGHLFYTELGNIFNLTDNSLSNKGDFLNLQPYVYWSGTKYFPDIGAAWYFYFSNGKQSHAIYNDNLFAIAVRPGDVTVVPEPVSMILFITGGGLLAGRRYFKRRR